MKERITKIIENGYEEFWEIENILYYVSEKSSNGSTYNVIYSNLNDCKSESDELYRYSSNNGVFSDNEFDKIKDDLDTYIYKFDRVEDKYLIKSITLK